MNLASCPGGAFPSRSMTALALPGLTFRMDAVSEGVYVLHIWIRRQRFAVSAEGRDLVSSRMRSLSRARSSVGVPSAMILPPA